MRWILAVAALVGCGESEDPQRREAEAAGDRALAYSKAHPTPDAMPPLGLDAAALPNANMPTPPRSAHDEWMNASRSSEPTFKAISADAHEQAIEDAAQRAVYERCSRFAVWREGSTLDGTYTFRRAGAPEVVNVSVKLARYETVANGNTLWYRVDFVGGKPSTIRAMKDVSAQLCGLDAPDRAYPL